MDVRSSEIRLPPPAPAFRLFTRESVTKITKRIQVGYTSPAIRRRLTRGKIRVCVIRRRRFSISILRVLETDLTILKLHAEIKPEKIVNWNWISS